jgi:hypothetical protein
VPIVVYARDVSTFTPATETTKTDIENTVRWFLSDKLQDASVPIATKKFLTNDNVLVYLTHCNVAEISVARIKVQVSQRVEGGVRQTDYQIFSDHRMMKTVNEMIFGTKPGTATGNESVEVGEEEAAQVDTLVRSLTEARQTL